VGIKRSNFRRSNFRRSKQKIKIIVKISGDRNGRSKQEVEIIAKFQEIEMALGALRGLG
jgi:hypothetical protein